MVQQKSPRNKTLDISVADGKEYLRRCLTKQDDLSDPSFITGKTICGDTMKLLSRLPEHFADLVIVDPPYNLNKNYDGKKFNVLHDDEYRKYTQLWMSKLKPILKENGSIYVCCDWKSSLIIGEVMKSYFKIQNRITWQREKGRGAVANWKNGLEDIWFGTNSDTYTFNLEAVKIRKKVLAPYKADGQPKDWQETPEGKYRDTCPSNFWDDISVPYWSMPENTAHPTQKPEKLIAKLILASSNAGDTVFDPFVGSGTTSVVAQKLQRRYCGIEQNERYCIWCEKRLETAREDTRIQGYVDGLFWERNSLVDQNKARKK